MTNKIVVFTFNQTPAERKVSEVTLGSKSVDSAAAQKATAIMIEVMNRFVPPLQQKSQAHYAAFMASKQFTVSFELPENENKFTVRVFNGANVDITFPLSDTTSKSLKESLDTVVSITTAPTSPTISPYLPSIEETPLLLSQPEKSLQPTLPLVITQTNKVAPPSHSIVYRFFAAIGNYFMNLFSSDTSEKPKRKYAPLTPKEHKATSGQASASTAQAKTDPIVRPGVAGIRPLENGNNICFINAVFQALMNMPEMIPLLTEAHTVKIAKEAEAIEALQTEIATEESTYFFPFSNSSRRPELSKLKASRKASITLNQALRTYTNGAKNPVWLKALRGFIPGSVGGSSQEDASELLDKIFDPLLEPLRHGVNAEGLPDMSIIPADINPALRDSLGRFIPKFGEEKQLQLVAAIKKRHQELAALDDATPLPPGSLRKEMVASSILPFAIPNARTALQDLVTAQLTMQKPAVQDNTSVYVENGVRGDYQVSQKRSVIESLNKNAPEFVSIQLKRFNADLDGNISKNNSEIVLPKNNKITLVVDGKNVDYEIQTLVMHRGTPRSGHYFSYVRKDGAWFEANDLHVAQLTDLPASVEKEAYLIVLKRVH